MGGAIGGAVECPGDGVIGRRIVAAAVVPVPVPQPGVPFGNSMRLQHCTAERPETLRMMLVISLRSASARPPLLALPSTSSHPAGAAW